MNEVSDTRWRSFLKYTERMCRYQIAHPTKMDGLFVEKRVSYWYNKMQFGDTEHPCKYGNLWRRESRGLKVVYPKEFQ